MYITHANRMKKHTRSLLEAKTDETDTEPKACVLVSEILCGSVKIKDGSTFIPATQQLSEGNDISVILSICLFCIPK